MFQHMTKSGTRTAREKGRENLGKVKPKTEMLDLPSTQGNAKSRKYENKEVRGERKCSIPPFFGPGVGGGGCAKTRNRKERSGDRAGSW